MITRFFIPLLCLVFVNPLSAFCFRLAGEEFDIDPLILYSIAKVESGINPDAINVNKNESVDIGIMQINTIHRESLAQNNIELTDLFEPCKNIIAGAWILKKNIIKARGDVWMGVGFYHSGNKSFYAPYIAKVKKQFSQIDENDIAMMDSVS